MESSSLLELSSSEIAIGLAALAGFFSGFFCSDSSSLLELSSSSDELLQLPDPLLDSESVFS